MKKVDRMMSTLRNAGHRAVIVPVVLLVLAHVALRAHAGFEMSSDVKIGAAPVRDEPKKVTPAVEASKPATPTAPATTEPKTPAPAADSKKVAVATPAAPAAPAKPVAPAPSPSAAATSTLSPATATPAPAIAQPVKSPATCWVIDPRQKKLSNAMDEWAQQAGWQQPIWESKKDFDIEVGATFCSSFEEAIKSVVETYKTSDAPIKAKGYRGNRVIVFSSGAK